MERFITLGIVSLERLDHFDQAMYCFAGLVHYAVQLQRKEQNML